MAQTLRLEYECTEAEQKEAKTLGLRKELGRGSKWRTRLILAGMGLVTVLDFYLKLRQTKLTELPFLLGIIVLVTVVYLVLKRRAGKPHKVATQVEVSEQGLCIRAGEANAFAPWSTFGACLESANLFVLLTRDKTTLVTLPKRVFPSESWQSWFRALATQERPPAELVARPNLTLQAPAGSLRLEFRLGLRDYADRALASWRTGAMVLGVTGLVLGTCVYAALHPPPHPVYSSPRLFFTFELPFTVAMAVMVVSLATVYPWLLHRKLLIPQHLALSESGTVVATLDYTNHQPWSAYTYYKETPWSFILWSRQGDLWHQLPKRAFVEPDGLVRCRALLRTHLRPSRWYFG